jgi:hypothetical protein
LRHSFDFIERHEVNHARADVENGDSREESFQTIRVSAGENFSRIFSAACTIN